MISLNLKPTFDAEVSITVPGQPEPGMIPLTFKYMGRKEYVAWMDSNKEEKDKKGKVTKEGKTFIAAFPEFVEGWGLPEDFTPENIEIFLNNYPAAYFEIFSEYSKLLLTSRIKN